MYSLLYLMSTCDILLVSSLCLPIYSGCVDYSCLFVIRLSFLEWRLNEPASWASMLIIPAYL
jgi:hypothetical protein